MNSSEDAPPAEVSPSGVLLATKALHVSISHASALLSKPVNLLILRVTAKDRMQS